jgi:transcription-repair coupling factor (superfamily II helicase)
VQTYVLEYDEAVIYDAMRRELSRGGQVFYIYNKIEDIDMVATRIMKALPDARVAVAHGAMDKDEIEDIWQALVKAEIDILVSTTIIETGVDLHSANTLIIENADRMGLSQLHQIRGRVGRSERQAYAYFTFRQGKALSDVARKRLVAIREFATFGAGFKVALRDLEIRGAGNLLGAEQHGYIESVGYDLYVKLLSEAVLEESGRASEAPFESVVDIRVSANIPDRYISVNAQRMEMYKKISLICDTGDAEDILDEFIDRFGEPPRETEDLIKISLVRALASACRICKVEFTNQIIFHLERMDLGIWSELFGKFPQLAFRAALTPSVSYRIMKGERALDAAVSVLSEYKALLSEEAKGAQDEEK